MENKEHKCTQCELLFTSHSLKANHIRWYHKDKEFYENYIEKTKLVKKERDDLLLGEYINETVLCSCCNNKKIEIEYRLNGKSYKYKKKKTYFCSNICRKGYSTKLYNKSDESKKIRSEKTKKLWQNKEYLDKMINVMNTRSESSKKFFTSKNEIIIRSFFIENFPDDVWTYGAGIIFEGRCISRDLYSNKLKICVEYDGIWHFKDIKGQLKDKQEKDKLLENWCLINNYRLVRISEDYYLKDKEKSLLELINLVYNSTENIIKLY